MDTIYHPAQIVQVLRSTAPKGLAGVSTTADRLAVVGTVSDESRTVTPLGERGCSGQADVAHVPLFAVTATPHVLGSLAVPLIPVDFDLASGDYFVSPGDWQESGNWAVGSLNLAEAVIAELLASPLYTGTETLMPIWDRDKFDRD